MSKKTGKTGSITHVFNTSGLVKEPQNEAIMPTGCEVRHMCQLQQRNRVYDIEFINLVGVLSNNNQGRIFVFDKVWCPDYPTDGYSQGSRHTLQNILHRYGLICAFGANFINCFWSYITPIPNSTKGIRIVLGNSNKHIDVTHDDNILKCLLAIHGAQLFCLLGAYKVEYLLSWIRKHVTVNNEDEYAHFPIFRCMEQLALLLLESSYASDIKDSIYARYVCDVCKRYIGTYSNFLTAIEEEYATGNIKNKAPEKLGYSFKLQELQRMMVGTLRHLLQMEEADYFTLQSQCTAEINIKGKNNDDLDSFLKSMISEEKLKFSTPVLRYRTVEKIDNLVDFCKYCNTYGFELTPDKDLQKTLHDNPKLLQVINHMILEKSLDRCKANYRTYTLRDVAQIMVKEESFLAQLKKDLFKLALNLCSYLHVPKWSTFEEIDFAVLSEHFDKLPSLNQSRLLDKLLCPLKKWPHYLDFLKYVCGSVQCGYFRIPSRPDTCMLVPEVDLISEIDNLPLAYKQHMTLLTEQKLHYLIYLLTINKRL